MIYRILFIFLLWPAITIADTIPATPMGITSCYNGVGSASASSPDAAMALWYKSGGQWVPSGACTNYTINHFSCGIVNTRNGGTNTVPVQCNVGYYQCPAGYQQSTDQLTCTSQPPISCNFGGSVSNPVPGTPATCNQTITVAPPGTCATACNPCTQYSCPGGHTVFNTCDSTAALSCPQPNPCPTGQHHPTAVGTDPYSCVDDPPPDCTLLGPHMINDPANPKNCISAPIPDCKALYGPHFHNDAPPNQYNCVPDPYVNCPVEHPGTHNTDNWTCAPDTPGTCSAGYSWVTGQGCLPNPPNNNNNNNNQSNTDPNSNTPPPQTNVTGTNYSTTTTTTCTGSTCTSQTTGTTSGGQMDTSGLAQESTQSRMDNNLKALADAQKARAATVEGQKCDTPPVCDGDPIQCALLSQLYQASCQIDAPTQSDIDGVIQQAGGKTQVQTGSITLPSLDASGLGYAGSCPTIPPVTIFKGATFSIDTSPMCDLAVILGNLLVITATFIALRILAHPSI